MDFKFSKDTDDSQPADGSGEKKNQSALLVLLLILVGGFTYIYFFTGLIKPLNEQKTSPVPVAAPQAVKMPLPSRDGEPAKENEKASTAEAPKTVAPTPPAAPPASATKTAAAPATPTPTSAATPATKPAPAPAKPKEEPKKAEAAKPAEKKPQPVAVADKKTDKAAVVTKVETKKTTEDVKKPVIADKKSPPAKDAVKKPAQTGQAKPAPVVKAQKETSAPWSIVVGNYVLEEALSADMGRVRKAGLEPIVKPSTRKKSSMNRLFVSDFSDRATAQSTLEKLKRHTSDAFIIEQGGKFALYAGSYLQSGSAQSEKERLKAAGFSTTIRHSDIAIPSQSLLIGPFASKKAAVAALDKLKRSGLKATISQK